MNPAMHPAQRAPWRKVVRVTPATSTSPQGYRLGLECGHQMMAFGFESNYRIKVRCKFCPAAEEVSP